MLTNPKENRTQPAIILIEEFRRKGYQCREVQEQDVTIIFLTHEKKAIAQSDGLLPEVKPEPFKKFLGRN